MLTVQLINTTGSLAGTLRTTYDRAGTEMALNLKGIGGSTLGMRFRVDAKVEEIPGTITGDVGVVIALCNLLEVFDLLQSTCVCALNAARVQPSNASSTCLCDPPPGPPFPPPPPAASHFCFVFRLSRFGRWERAL